MKNTDIREARQKLKKKKCRKQQVGYCISALLGWKIEEGGWGGVGKMFLVCFQQQVINYIRLPYAETLLPKMVTEEPTPCPYHNP